MLRHHDVPLDRDASSRLLPWLIAVMVYLAALALVVAMSMGKLAARWDQGLANSLTIQVPAGDTPEARQRSLQDIHTLVEELRAIDAVEEVAVLEEEDLNRLLEPWLGKDVVIQDLPVPYLVTVTLEQMSGPVIDAVNDAVTRTLPQASVDDHQRWLANLLGLARVVESVALLTVLLVGGAAAVMVILVTRMGLAIHRQLVELFHLMGAYDSYIARRFQFHALKLSFYGGAIGLLLAGITVAALSNLLGQANSALLPSLTLSTIEWATLALIPVGAALIAMITARMTVLKNLSKMP